MTMPECKKSDTCNAPLCPLDEQSLKHGIWLSRRGDLPRKGLHESSLNPEPEEDPQEIAEDGQVFHPGHA